MCGREYGDLHAKAKVAKDEWELARIALAEAIDEGTLRLFPGEVK